MIWSFNHSGANPDAEEFPADSGSSDFTNPRQHKPWNSSNLQMCGCVCVCVYLFVMCVFALCVCADVLSCQSYKSTAAYSTAILIEPQNFLFFEDASVVYIFVSLCVCEERLVASS